MTKAAPRLGKGLAALIGSRESSGARSHAAAPTAEPPSSPEKTEQTIASLSIDLVSPNPWQPRARFDDAALDDLAASITSNGLLQPLLVRPKSDGTFQLIAGERRWRAARRAGLDHVPAIVRETSDNEALEIALIENLQREDLGPLERAKGYRQLIDNFGSTADEIATRLGESRSNVTNYLRILNLDGSVQAMIADGQLAMGQARAILGVSNPRRQLAIARLAVRRNLSTRQVEALVRNEVQGSDLPEEDSRTKAASHHLQNVAGALSKSTGLKVSLHPGRRKNSGRIVIHYNSLEEFDQVAERLGGRAHLE